MSGAVSGLVIALTHAIGESVRILGEVPTAVLCGHLMHGHGSNPSAFMEALGHVRSTGVVEVSCDLRLLRWVGPPGSGAKPTGKWVGPS